MNIVGFFKLQIKCEYLMEDMSHLPFFLLVIKNSCIMWEMFGNGKPQILM